MRLWFYLERREERALDARALRSRHAVAISSPSLSLSVSLLEIQLLMIHTTRHDTNFVFRASAKR